MVVQHNLTAMNSNRMLGLTSKAQAKSTEKLSSGYKINRAADDAAGLAISEKMRKQIRGLTQASANAQDGISTVQTAEGALTEVHDMLQRMNELAVKASNGTMSESDRQSVQDEVNQLLTEIDRVSETTKFNEMYLLKGDEGTHSVDLKAHDAGLKGTLATEGSTGRFTAAELKDDEAVSIGGKTYTIGDTSGNLTSAKGVEKALADAMKAGDEDDTITIDGKEYTASVENAANTEKAVKEILSLGIKGTSAAIKDTIKIEDADGNETTYTYLQTLKSEDMVEKLTVAATDGTLTAGDTITIGDKKYEYADTTKIKTTSDAENDFTKKQNALTKNTSKIKVDGVEYTCLAVATAAGSGDGAIWKSSDGKVIWGEKLQLKEGDSYSTDGTAWTRVSDKITEDGFYDADFNKLEVPKNLEEGTFVAVDRATDSTTPPTKGSYVVGDSSIRGFYNESGKLLTTDDVDGLVAAGTKITFSNVTDVDGKVTDPTNTGTKLTVTQDVALEVKSLAWKDGNDELTRDMIKDLADGTKVDVSFTSKSYTVGTPGDKISREQAYELMAEELKAANSIGTKDEITVTNNGDGTFEFNLGTVETVNALNFNLHVGADADMTNKIGVKIDTMSTDFLGVKDLNVVGKGNDGGIAATYAVDAIEDAIKKVSEQRSALGAVQNRLEHTINNLDNVVENTTSAESAIRDTDMATEMVRYSNNNILAQAGQAMLAQANQSNQGVLSLLG